MADKNHMSGNFPGSCPGTNFKEAVCLDTNKIYDTCRDKDCLEDLRVYLCYQDQSLIENAISIKAKNAEILWVYIDVEAVPFNRGFYTVNVKYFFRICFDICLGVGRPQEIKGLASFEKQAILFGSEGNAKVFSSTFKPSACDPQNITSTNLPKASVEVVDPIVLGTRIVEKKHCCCCECDVSTLPEFVCHSFDGDLCDSLENKKLVVTLGIFSIIRLERKVQLLIPAYDFCIPDKECCGASEDKPCDLFRTIKFPMDEFFPPVIRDFPGACCNKPDCNCK